MDNVRSLMLKKFGVGGTAKPEVLDFVQEVVKEYVASGACKNPLDVVKLYDSLIRYLVDGEIDGVKTYIEDKG
jgi:hypothetical protein